MYDASKLLSLHNCREDDLLDLAPFLAENSRLGTLACILLDPKICSPINERKKEGRKAD